MDQKSNFTMHEKQLLEIVFGKKIEKNKINQINYLIFAIILFIIIFFIPLTNIYYKIIIYLIILVLTFLLFNQTQFRKKT